MSAPGTTNTQSWGQRKLGDSVPTQQECMSAAIVELVRSWYDQLQALPLDSGGTAPPPFTDRAVDDH